MKSNHVSVHTTVGQKSTRPTLVNKGHYFIVKQKKQVDQTEYPTELCSAHLQYYLQPATF